jgi:hypothetical protein
MRKIRFLSVFVWLLATGAACGYGQTGQKPAAQNSSSAIERLRGKLTQYVAEGKVFETSKIVDFNKPSEFGKHNGELSAGHAYTGNNYSLLISFERTGDSQLKIIDFLLDEKNKLSVSDHSYDGCAVYKNGKMKDGFYNGDLVCKEISVVKLESVKAKCMTLIPVVKAWKKNETGKYVEADATGLTWYEYCP